MLRFLSLTATSAAVLTAALLGPATAEAMTAKPAGAATPAAGLPRLGLQDLRQGLRRALPRPRHGADPGLGAFGSYSEVSGLEGQILPGSLPANTPAPYDAPGTLGAWTTQALTSDTSIVGVISPVRVGDVTRPVHIELPGIVHRVPAGHRLRLVLASTDAAYQSAYAVQPVTVTANPLAPAVLRIPVVR